MIRRLVLALVAAAAIAACGGRMGSSARAKGAAIVKFDSSVRAGEVWINGQLVPNALRNGVEVPPGSYRIEVRNERYHTVYFEISVKNGETRTLTVRPAAALP